MSVPTDLLSEMLLPPLNLSNRPNIRLPRRKHKVQTRNNQRDHEDRRRPVEARSRHRHSLRPEAPEERPETVQYCGDVDWYTPAAEGEFRGWESFGVLDAAPEDLKGLGQR